MVKNVAKDAGGEAVTLSRSHYEALLARIEDLEARLAFNRSREEESFPASVAKRLAAGESPVRVFRQHRGLTLRALAREAALSPSYLSEIEAGRKEGSASTLRRLADALGVDLDDLV